MIMYLYRFIPSKTHFRMMPPNYESWSKEELITRLGELEAKKHAQSTHSPTRKNHSHPKGKIAIKFCYLLGVGV
ncbi:uncharacterized protein BJ212DRAFT_1406977 [Suillus subaureus]|uniref:Uncharacterized protein n=1 Tax=Suillus subaureus TaxID=48587 RepID=A0A9P7DK84_9AGAM|nr:uncharacterized protein BJ212DRAFT_1406977 [Suillus subaureus]KAG1796912.1 hypothetical protein BJ212DRAFT_1406977 [Suillus subaureus]